MTSKIMKLIFFSNSKRHRMGQLLKTW